MVYIGYPPLLFQVGFVLLAVGVLGLLLVHWFRKPLATSGNFKFLTARGISEWLKLDGFMSLAATAAIVGGAIIILGIIAWRLGN